MTRKFLAITGLSTFVLLMSTTLFASGFCDDTPIPDDNRGGYCTQVREAFEDFDGTILPDYSDLDLLGMLGNSVSAIEFELRVANLFPEVQLQGSAGTETAIFELQLKKSLGMVSTATAHQALLLTVSRDLSGNLSLDLDWLGVPAGWSITEQAAPAPTDSWHWVSPAALHATEFNIRLVPSSDWKSIDASISTLDDNPLSEQVSHKVFTLPSAGPQKAKAWRLRSGILAGTLTRGMQVQLDYRQPFIDEPYR